MLNPMFTNTSLLKGLAILMTAVAVCPSVGQTPLYLWDREPALWDEAQTFKLVRPLSPVFGWEGPHGRFEGARINRTPGPEYTGPSGEGVNISNERVQSALWGTPDRLVFSVGKTDVHDRARLSFRRGRKPVGQLLLLAEDFEGADPPAVTTHLHNGTHTLRLAKGEATADLQVLLSRSDTNVFAIQADYAHLTRPVAVRLHRHRDKFGELPEPESGREGAYFWIRQSFAADKTFPDGFEYYLVAKVVPAAAAIELEQMKPGLGAPVPVFREDTVSGSAATARIPAAVRVRMVVYATVVTTAESDDPLAEARRRLDAAEAQGYDGLRTRNEAWHRALYERREQGRIFTGNFDDVRRVVLPFFFQGSFQSRHTFTSNPDPAKYEGDAHYTNLESDEVYWSGLPCFNEELYTGEYVAGRDETVAPYYVGLYRFWREAWEARAQALGYDGLLVLRGYVPPIKNDVYWSPDGPAMNPNGCDWATLVWSFKCVWDAFDYGGQDLGFLAEQVYPSLRGIADFFASLVKRGDDGRYHIERSQIREEDVGRNAIDCIAAAKWAFRRAIEAAQLLEVDAGRRAVWQERLDKMAPYDLIPNEQGEQVFASLIKDGIPVVAGHGTSHFLVNVADEIHLESAEEEKQLALRSNRIAYTQPMNRQVEFLLGVSPDTLCMTSVFAHPAWLRFYAQKSGAGDFAGLLPLETPAQKAIACWLEPERLCNSRSGAIHFFPCAPGDFDVAFKDFQARGGFLVTAERRGGVVTHAQIQARRDGPCRLMNPWPGRELHVREWPANRPVPVTREGARHVFPAVAGRVYVLSTESAGADPAADMSSVSPEVQP